MASKRLLGTGDDGILHPIQPWNDALAAGVGRLRRQLRHSPAMRPAARSPQHQARARRILKEKPHRLLKARYNGYPLCEPAKLEFACSSCWSVCAAKFASSASQTAALTAATPPANVTAL
ncbi:hypothetical protein CFE70_001808 [Pyrenophora teres f. teres 0-1]